MAAFLLLAAGSAGSLSAAPGLEAASASVVDFGKYPAHEQRTARYILKNTGNVEVRILRARTGCGCASAQIDRHEIATAETATVTVLGPVKVTGSTEVESRMERIGDVPGEAYRLTLTSQSARTAGDVRCAVSIPVLEPTNHPPVRLTVHGSAGYELAAVPGFLRLPVSDSPQRRKFFLRLLGEKREAPKPPLLVLPKITGLDFVVAEKAARVGLTVTVVASPEFTKQLMADERMSFAIGYPGYSSATVTCLSAKGHD